MIDGLDVKIEDDVRRHLASWKRWQLGEGVAGVGNTLGYCEERMMTIDSNRNNDRPVVITHECERTNRAVFTCGATSPGGWWAKTPDSMHVLPAGNAASYDLLSTSGTTSLNFEWSFEVAEG